MAEVPPDLKIPFDKPLFRGMKGEDVKRLQRNLNSLNFYFLFYKDAKGNEIGIPETGLFGDQTIRILKEFQKFCNLPPSGMYEIKTHEMLEWKNYRRLYNTQIAYERLMQEQAKIKEAEKAAKLARSMAAVNKLFSDGKFGGK